jgi:hypothetical protein
MKNIILISIISFFGFKTLGQGKFIEIGSSFGSNLISPSAGIYKDFSLGKKDRLIIGTGLRYTGFLGKEVLFTSAPADIAADVSKTDTLSAPKPSIHALNVMINLGFKITKKLQLGFNIDAAGISFGPEGEPTYIGNRSRTPVKAKPTSPNVLLVGNNDIGSLNSLFYANYSIKEKLGISAGYQFMFNELKTNTKVQTNPEPNDRFRTKTSSIYIGLRIGI